jgi:co-chaperonin GroES (HSP10)
MRITGNRVRILRLPQETKSRGGIYYAMQLRDDEKLWIVSEIGPGRVNKRGILIAPEVQRGDRVVVNFDLGFKDLPDGSRIVDAGQLLMKW